MEKISASTGFTGSVKNLGVILRELVIFFVCALPYLVPMGAVAGIVLLIIKAVGKKKKENNPPQQTPNS